MSGCTLRVSNANNANHQYLRQYMRLPKFFLKEPTFGVCTSSYMPQPDDSGGLSHPRHYSGASFRLRGTLNPSPTSQAFRSCTNSQGIRLPLRPARFSVYASSGLFTGFHPFRLRRNTRLVTLVPRLYAGLEILILVIPVVG